MKSIVIKMMSNEDKPDTNNSKGFRLVETEGEVLCTRDNDGKPIITVIKEEGPSEVYHPEGNTYILQNGKLSLRLHMLIIKQRMLVKQHLDIKLLN